MNSYYEWTDALHGNPSDKVDISSESISAGLSTFFSGADLGDVRVGHH